MAGRTGRLPDTGRDITDWLLIAGWLVLLGVILLAMLWLADGGDDYPRPRP